MFNECVSNTAVIWLLICAGTLTSAAEGGDMNASDEKQAAGAEFRAHRFLPVKPLSRAGRPARIGAVIENVSDVTTEVTPRLVLPEGVRLVDPTEAASITIDGLAAKEVFWEIEAEAEGEVTVMGELAHVELSTTDVQVTAVVKGSVMTMLTTPPLTALGRSRLEA